MIRKATLKQLDNALWAAGRKQDAYFNVFGAGVYAVFTTTGDSADKLGRYLKHRFPALWNDFSAVTVDPTPAALWEESASRGIVRLEVVHSGKSFWSVEL